MPARSSARSCGPRQSLTQKGSIPAAANVQPKRPEIQSHPLIKLVHHERLFARGDITAKTHEDRLPAVAERCKTDTFDIFPARLRHRVGERAKQLFRDAAHAKRHPLFSISPCEAGCSPPQIRKRGPPMRRHRRRKTDFPKRTGTAPSLLYSLCPSPRGCRPTQRRPSASCPPETRCRNRAAAVCPPLGAGAAPHRTYVCEDRTRSAFRIFPAQAHRGGAHRRRQARSLRRRREPAQPRPREPFLRRAPRPHSTLSFHRDRTERRDRAHGKNRSAPAAPPISPFSMSQRSRARIPPFSSTAPGSSAQQKQKRR